MWRATGASDDNTELQFAIYRVCLNEAGESWETVAEDLEG